MYCGACGIGNVPENQFCTGCGKPLMALAHAANGRYSVILQSAPLDEVERFRVIRQLAGLLKLSEQEMAARVKNTPSTIASVESLVEGEHLQQRLRGVGVAVLIRPYGKEPLETRNGNGKPTPPSVLQEPAVMAELQQLKASQNGLRAIMLRLAVYSVGFIVICGLFRVYYGGGIGVKLVWKESFSFKDTIVNVDDVTGMPRIVVATQHPQVKRQLENMGIVETDEQVKDRFADEVNKETEKLLNRFHSY